MRRRTLTRVLATYTCCQANRRDGVAHPPHTPQVAEGASKTEASTPKECHQAHDVLVEFGYYFTL